MSCCVSDQWTDSVECCFMTIKAIRHWLAVDLMQNVVHVIVFFFVVVMSRDLLIIPVYSTHHHFRSFKLVLNHLLYVLDVMRLLRHYTSWYYINRHSGFIYRTSSVLCLCSRQGLFVIACCWRV